MPQIMLTDQHNTCVQNVLVLFGPDQKGSHPTSTYTCTQCAMISLVHAVYEARASYSVVVLLGHVALPFFGRLQHTFWTHVSSLSVLDSVLLCLYFYGFLLPQTKKEISTSIHMCTLCHDVSGVCSPRGTGLLRQCTSLGHAALPSLDSRRHMF